MRTIILNAIKEFEDRASSAPEFMRHRMVMADISDEHMASLVKKWVGTGDAISLAIEVSNIVAQLCMDGSVDDMTGKYLISSIRTNVHLHIWEERHGQSLADTRTMPYADYLQSPEWKAIRAQAIEAAGGRCQVCNSSSHLNVHHRTYERRGAEGLQDLTVLCSECHSLFHQNSSLVKQAG